MTTKKKIIIGAIIGVTAYYWWYMNRKPAVTTTEIPEEGGSGGGGGGGGIGAGPMPSIVTPAATIAILPSSNTTVKTILQTSAPKVTDPVIDSASGVNGPVPSPPAPYSGPVINSGGTVSLGPGSTTTPVLSPAGPTGGGGTATGMSSGGSGTVSAPTSGGTTSSGTTTAPVLPKPKPLILFFSGPNARKPLTLSDINKRR